MKQVKNFSEILCQCRVGNKKVAVDHSCRRRSSSLSSWYFGLVHTELSSSSSSSSSSASSSPSSLSSSIWPPTMMTFLYNKSGLALQRERDEIAEKLCTDADMSWHRAKPNGIHLATCVLYLSSSTLPLSLSSVSSSVPFFLFIIIGHNYSFPPPFFCFQPPCVSPSIANKRRNIHGNNASLFSPHLHMFQVFFSFFPPIAYNGISFHQPVSQTFTSCIF